MSKFLLSFHITIFIACFAVWFFIPHPMQAVSIILVCICLYLVFFNLKNREILPAMVIIMLTELVKAAVEAYLKDPRLYHLMGYIAALSFTSLAQSFLLFRYHADPRLQQLFGVEFRRLYIPQVLAICMLSFANAVFYLAMLSEVVIFAIDDTFFSGMPFFHKNASVITSFITGGVIVALWSMMLDAHYLKARLDKLRASTFNS
jgi:hypothetical protein